MDHRTEILDLRTALEVLRQTPGQLVWKWTRRRSFPACTAMWAQAAP